MEEQITISKHEYGRLREIEEAARQLNSRLTQVPGADAGYEITKKEA